MIDNLAVLDGELPSRIIGLVVEWAGLHKTELLDDWNSIQETGKYYKIAPLV